MSSKSANDSPDSAAKYFELMASPETSPGGPNFGIGDTNEELELEDVVREMNSEILLPSDNGGLKREGIPISIALASNQDDLINDSSGFRYL